MVISMNFQEAYKKVQNGVATEEEKLFVESEIQKSNQIQSVVNADKQKNKKKFNCKIAIKIALIALCGIALITVIVLAIIFVPFYKMASSNQSYTKDACVKIAKDSLVEYGFDISDLSVSNIDRELRINYAIDNAVYVYEIEFQNYLHEYSVEVNSQTGAVVIDDID